jgi:hypothetical protein
MNTKRQDRVPNKAGMDNRWGCFVGDVFRDLTSHLVLTLTPSQRCRRLNDIVKEGQMDGTRGRLVVLPPLPGRWFIVMLYRWLTPPANVCQASGLGACSGME